MNISESTINNFPDGNGSTTTATVVTDAKGNTLTYTPHHWCYVGHLAWQARIVTAATPPVTTYYNSPSLGFAAFNKL